MVPKYNIFIGLGSNISPEANLHKAAAMLKKHFPNIRFSSVYRSSAREVEAQNDFLNAAARVPLEDQEGQLETRNPQQLLLFLQSIEKSLGKAPPYRFGPRTIDLDLLLYGTHILPSIDEWRSCKLKANSYQLILPHPRMHERRFVLEPLCELIDPSSLHPVLQESWQELLTKTLNQACHVTEIVL